MSSMRLRRAGILLLFRGSLGGAGLPAAVAVGGEAVGFSEGTAEGAGVVEAALKGQFAHRDVGDF